MSLTLSQAMIALIFYDIISNDGDNALDSLERTKGDIFIFAELV